MVTRGFGRLIMSLLAPLVLLVTTGGIDAAADGERGQIPAKRPNILIIVTDDQTADTLDVMPKTRDFFKKNGTKFPNAFVSTPLCCPSRASIFSGRYAHNHGVFRTGSDPALFDQESTMQARLRNAGYLTAISGKYLNSWTQAIDPPHFDRWAFFSRGRRGDTDGYYNLPFNVDGKRRIAQQYSTRFVQNRALEFLNWFERNDGRPWFLYVAPFAPHPPALPEPKYSNERIPKWIRNPAFFEKEIRDKPQYVQLSNRKQWRTRRMRARQLRSLLSVDDMVGRLAGRLDDLGEERDTVAIFLSDNGYLWGEHRLTGKGVPYTGSIKVPMMMRWPGHVRRGAIDTRFALNIDVAPTALDVAGLSADAMDGRSLTDKSWQRDRVLLEFWGGTSAPIPGWASIRTSEHQYIEYYAKGSDGEEVMEREFYDLQADRWQLENLSVDEDPSNDPPQWMVDQLAADRSCFAVFCP